MSSSTRRKKLRDVLSGRGTSLAATIFDPFSARMADLLEFEAGLMGGSLASYMVLGAPDLILLTLTELAEQVHRCTRASLLPIVIDCDHGYGNALNVMRTVEEIDHAGAAAIMIEDTLLPQAYGSPMPQILSREESAGKLRAAIKARGDSDLIILGRTSAHTITGIEDAIARCTAFKHAGVDGLMLPGLRTRDELDRIAAAVDLPIMAGSPAEAMLDNEYLASRNVRLLSTGHHTLNVAMNALFAAMKQVRAGTPASKLQGADAKKLLGLITAEGDYQASIEAYLGSSRPVG